MLNRLFDLLQTFKNSHEFYEIEGKIDFSHCSHKLKHLIEVYMPKLLPIKYKFALFALPSLITQ